MAEEKNNINCYNCKKKLSESLENKSGDKGFITLEEPAKILRICNECSKKIANRCHTCYLPIYKSDLLYEISIIRGAEYFVSASEEAKKIQCSRCYNRWSREQEKKKWINWGLLITLFSCIIWLLFITLPIFYPKLRENWKKTSLFNRCTLILLLSIIPIIITYLLVQEFSSRYKVREKRVKTNNMESNNENKKFCADCGVEFNESEMVRRKNEKGIIQWICIRCASRY